MWLYAPVILWYNMKDQLGRKMFACLSTCVPTILLLHSWKIWARRWCVFKISSLLFYQCLLQIITQEYCSCCRESQASLKTFGALNIVYFIGFVENWFVFSVVYPNLKTVAVTFIVSWRVSSMQACCERSQSGQERKGEINSLIIHSFILSVLH